MRLWVDDLRTPPYGTLPNGNRVQWDWAKSSDEAIYMLRVHGPYVSEISLDHDLGGDDTTRPVVLYMIENDIRPPAIHVHTANPVGREWLEGMIARYL